MLSTMRSPVLLQEKITHWWTDLKEEGRWFFVGAFIATLVTYFSMRSSNNFMRTFMIAGVMGMVNINMAMLIGVISAWLICKAMKKEYRLLPIWAIISYGVYGGIVGGFTGLVVAVVIMEVFLRLV